MDKPLELIQKTYHLQRTTEVEHHSRSRVSTAKVSTHQPSRKTSIHDIHEGTRDDLNKILNDIQENLSRLKGLLENISSSNAIRNEFLKLKDHLFFKINEFISKLSNDSGKRGSITSKGHSNSPMISYHPQHLVYCLEYFRSELIKCQYLFNSLTFSASIGTSTLDTIIVKSLSNSNLHQIPDNVQDMQIYQDLMQIKKDIQSLEEHSHHISQRYYSQIPDWSGTSHISDGNNLNRLRVHPLRHHLSTTSSTVSNENTSSIAHFFQKCHIICCFCRPNYL